MVVKTLDVRVQAVLGNDFVKLRKDLEALALIGSKSGKAGQEAGQQTAKGMREADKEVTKLNSNIQNSTKYLQLMKGVVSAFLLYKGFSFLTQQAGQFTRTLVDVQHQIGIIQTQLNSTGKDYRPLVTQNIMRIAGETGVAMETLAKAEYQIVSANIKVADSFKVLELSAKAALSGGLGNVDLAFNAALSQVNVFGETFAEVYDKQFQVMKRGIFTYEQFSTVVGTLSEAFASMGQDIETANASLAAISQVFTGSQLERGATGLRNAILRIGEAPDDFRALGIEVTDANGEFRNFIEIAKDLKQVLDGMSSSARANVIKSLFPDERERRGIGAFLNQLDSAEQFFVEQQFAVGSLNEAYETANDSLKTQADMFRNDLIPAMQPFVDMAGVLLKVFNGMDAILPGLNKNLLTTATIGAVIGGGMLMTGGRFPLSKASSVPLTAGPMRQRMSGMMGSRMPTGLGWGAAGLMGASTFASGAQAGAAQPGDYIGSAIAGGATGMMVGGPVGAAVGTAVGLIATALGDAMDKDAPDVALSFTEAFTKELEKGSGSVADAFVRALNIEIDGGTTTPKGMRLEERVSETDKFMGVFPMQEGIGTNEQNKVILEALRRGDHARVKKQGAGVFGVSGTEERLISSEKDYNDFIAQSEFGSSAEVNIESTSKGRLSAGRQALREYQEFMSTVGRNEGRLGMRAKASGQSVDDVRARAIDEGIKAGSATMGLYGSEFDDGMRLFLEALNDGRVESGDLGHAFSLLEGGTDASYKAFLEFIGVMNDGTAQISQTFKAWTMEFEGMFKGDANLAADVFERMGTEGAHLASVFRSLSGTMQAFQTFQALNEMTVMKQQMVQRTTLTKDGKKMIGGTTSTMESIPANVLESILGAGGMQQVQNMLMDRLLADVGGINGTVNPASFFNALFPSPEEVQAKVVQPLEMGANSFADALFEASDMVRGGFMDGMGRTADELEMLGEEFKLLNRFVRQRSLLEELKGIAEFAGVGTDGIQGAMGILRGQMVKSGKALFDILGDPGSLAELIAKMEFGDVNLDQSTDFNIVLNISGGADLDTSKAAAFADAIITEVNNKTRDRMSVR